MNFITRDLYEQSWPLYCIVLAELEGGNRLVQCIYIHVCLVHTCVTCMCVCLYVTHRFTFVSIPQSSNFKMVAAVLLKGLKQAVRNCPWVVEFWVTLTRTQERLGEEHEEILGTAVTNKITERQTDIHVVVSPAGLSPKLYTVYMYMFIIIIHVHIYMFLVPHSNL